MMLTRPAVSLAMFVAFTLACGGDSPTSSGFIHVAQVQINPQTVNCGYNPLAMPPKWVASPDTVALQVQMVNSTSTAATLTTAGTTATIQSSPVATDVGLQVLNFTSLPFTPADNTIRARDGDVTFRVSLPLEPFCNSKAPSFAGTLDLGISIRMTTDRGIYTSTPQSLRVIW